MINALVYSNNIHFIQKLLDESNIQNLGIRFSQIITNKSQIGKGLKIPSPDLIFVDKALGKDLFKTLLGIHREILIPLSYNTSSNLMNEKILQEISALVDCHDLDKKRLKIINELEYIGYRFKYKGTHYLADTILQMYTKQNSLVDNLQSDIYPVIAEKYHKSIYNIKSSISKATECMYYECDSQRLANYFRFPEDVKPTVKQVVFTVVNKI